jgi:pyruvate ferredoxin oxidoreductase gamma subunit
MIDVRFHGRGGHGTKLAGRILGRSGFLAGLYVQDFSLFGAERQGAPVVACTRLSGEPIRGRGYVEEPDLVVIIDHSLLEEAGAQILAGVRFDTAVLINAWPADLDGFYLSFTREIVDVPEADKVRSFSIPRWPAPRRALRETRSTS